MFVQVILPLKLGWIPFYRSGFDGICPGDKVRVKFSGRVYIGVVYRVCRSLPASVPESKVLDIISIESGLERVAKQEIEFWELISSYYMCTVGEVFKTAFPAEKFVHEQIGQRKVERIRVRIEKNESLLSRARNDVTRQKYQAVLDSARSELESIINPGALCLPDDKFVLSDAQARAFDRICTAFAAGKTVLLDGVTGSGKTEIYTKCARGTLLEGRNVLYLLPEIAISRQLEERLRGYFGESLLVFHSHMTSAKRGEVASRVASGTPYIVLGTRSALFLPHRNLGLVIVDEEHDQSYKQDSPAPRYNARETAIMLASVNSANVILGSATPSLESRFNAMNGKFALVELKEKYHYSGETEIEVINTIAEAKKGGMHGNFSRKLINRVNETLSQGGQVMILRARRSYSPVLQCVECGSIPRCPKCNVALSMHVNGRAVCHHCGYSTRFVGYCKECGGALRGIGAGVQKIEEEAAALWPDARVARLDSDVSQIKGKEEQIIRDFADRKIDILVGTQIVTKGFDFAGLSLVAVIQADTLVGQQDFRADEKAWQLLEQFRGRCGRREKSGVFVIQTSRPDHPVYARLAGKETDMLSERLDFRYPPYFRLINIDVHDSFEDRAERIARKLCDSLYEALGDSVPSGDSSIVGPFAPDNNFKDKERSVRSIRLSLARNRGLVPLKEKISEAVKKFETENKYDGHITIDVDPV